MLVHCGVSSPTPTSKLLLRLPNLFHSSLRPSPSSMTTLSFSSSAAPDNAVAPSTPEPKPNKPWLLVGLGNPGKMYQRTRHNVGFEMLDAIADSEGISMGSVQFKARFGKVRIQKHSKINCGRLHGSNSSIVLDLVQLMIVLANKDRLVDAHRYNGHIGRVPVILAKPQTFMNASGESVGPIVSYYKIPLNQVLVMFDDLDLPFGRLRLLPKGGHGGQNGMRSIIERFGTRDFPRLRIGIGRPPGKMDPVNYVLRPFNKEEQAELEFTLQRGLEAVRILLLEGFDKSATFVNSAKTLKQLG